MFCWQPRLLLSHVTQSSLWVPGTATKLWHFILSTQGHQMHHEAEI